MSILSALCSLVLLSVLGWMHRLAQCPAIHEDYNQVCLTAQNPLCHHTVLIHPASEGGSPGASLQPHRAHLLGSGVAADPLLLPITFFQKTSPIPVVPTNPRNGLAWRYVLSIQLFCSLRKASQSHSLQSPSLKLWVCTQLLLADLNPVWDTDFCPAQSLQWSCQLPLGSDLTAWEVPCRPCQRSRYEKQTQTFTLDCRKTDEVME